MGNNNSFIYLNYVSFLEKLKALKPVLRSLGKEKFGDIPRHTREAHEDLCAKQEETLRHPSPTMMEEEIAAYAKWMNLSEIG